MGNWKKINSISETRKQEIIDGYKSGKTMQCLAEKYGINVGTIWYIFQEAGVQARKRTGHRRFTDKAERMRICNDYVNNNIDTPHLQKKYKAGAGTILRVLQEGGVKMRTISEINKATRKHSIDLEVIRNDSPEKFYWFGFICADGYVNDKTKTMRINLQHRDKEHLARLRSFLSYGSEIKDYIVNGCKASRFHVCSEDFLSELKKYGICQNKSLIVNPVNIPPQFEKYFIMGLFDGDGSISKSKRNNHAWSVGFCGSLMTMKFIARHLNYIAGKQVKIFPQSKIYYWRVGGSHLPYKILSYLYKGQKKYCLIRKYESFKQLEEYVLSRRKLQVA